MRVATLFSLLLLLSACAGDPPAAEGPEPAAAAVAPAAWTARDTPAVLVGRGIFQPQAAVAPDGGLILVWRENGPKPGAGSNLYLSRRPPGGAFSEPVRINDQTDSLGSWNHDENRAGVALGPDRRVAVAWTTRASTVRAAISSDGGASFAPSFQLNQDRGRAYHGFAAVAFDAAAVLHAIWIDSRDAEHVGAEEPADLYYARIEDGTVAVEHNLTAAAGEGSICGCCLPFMEVDGESLSIVFRNATDGYRDIYRVTGDIAGSFEEPARFGPPMWELQGCPSAGPVSAGGHTLWLEASTGRPRILAAADTDGSFSVVLENEAEWALKRPPRPAAGNTDLLLVPGDPTARLIRYVDSAWTSVGSVPKWATAAAFVDGELLVIGSQEGELRFAGLHLS